MKWLLPEYIRDMLPEEAWHIESMRARILQLFRRSGYQLVAPPLIEYAESLLIRDNADMDLRTFRLVDQLSGRTLALRADITPQVARIDAHLLNHQGITRLCYVGTVAHTQPAGLMSTREPLQIGAELYGHGGIESDLEIQRLMLQALSCLEIRTIHLDLGHVEVFRALLEGIALDRDYEQALFSALQHKDVPTLRSLVQPLPQDVQGAMLALPELYGGFEIIERARSVLPQLPRITAALAQLEHAAQQLLPLADSVGIDLADLRGYHYHSGMVFAAYHPKSHDAIALGGRYDNVGEIFGRARPATGFSMDLRQLYSLLPQQAPNRAILAPYRDDPALDAAIAALREQGEIVVVDLLGKAEYRAELNCDRELVLRDGEWKVIPIEN